MQTHSFITSLQRTENRYEIQAVRETGFVTIGKKLKGWSGRESEQSSEEQLRPQPSKRKSSNGHDSGGFVVAGVR